MREKRDAQEIEFLIDQYFYTRRVYQRDKSGELIQGPDGGYLYDEKPYTITGLAIALGFSSRDELFAIKNKKIRALIDRALLKIEESAEEKLFKKETYNGTRLFLSANFPRWGESAKTSEPEEEADLGICADWAK